MVSAIDAQRLLPKREQIAARDKAKQKQQEDDLHAQVAKQLEGLPEAVKEYAFHDKRRWRLDYAWPDKKIAAEIHGGVHSGGRHTRGAGFINDREKMNEAALLGWLVIEATAEQVKGGGLRRWLDVAFTLRQGINERVDDEGV